MVDLDDLKSFLDNLAKTQKYWNMLVRLAEVEKPFMAEVGDEHFDRGSNNMSGAWGNPGRLHTAGNDFILAHGFYLRSLKSNPFAQFLGLHLRKRLKRADQAVRAAVFAAHCFSRAQEFRQAAGGAEYSDELRRAKDAAHRAFGLYGPVARKVAEELAAVPTPPDWPPQTNKARLKEELDKIEYSGRELRRELAGL